MTYGIDIDPNVQAQVALNIVAQQAMHIAQLEAAVQQLNDETQRLQLTVDAMIDVQDVDE